MNTLYTQLVYLQKYRRGAHGHKFKHSRNRASCPKRNLKTCGFTTTLSKLPRVCSRLGTACAQHSRDHDSVYLRNDQRCVHGHKCKHSRNVASSVKGKNKTCGFTIKVTKLLRVRSRNSSSALLTTCGCYWLFAGLMKGCRCKELGGQFLCSLNPSIHQQSIKSINA